MNGINKSPLWHGSGFWVVISRCILEIQPHVCCCDFLLLAFVPFMPLSVESRLSFVQKHSVFGVCLFFFTLCQFVCFPPSVLCLSCILCALVLSPRVFSVFLSVFPVLHWTLQYFIVV